MAKKQEQPQTTAQQIGSLIATARKLMRKDKGLSTDIDRLPLLTWIMFLKFLDDMEQIEESKAAMRGDKYRPAIESPYRWRDWAADEAGITGPELLAFVNQDEAMRPDGTKGAGLLAYLRGLTGGNGAERRRRVIATVFKDITCRMMSGYILRDVINKVDGIHFLAKEELFTLGHLYETMLREMRDAAGENGEFYTPRPVVQFMVEVTDPRLGEVVLDPACGTGGFLCEAYAHLEKQAKTVKDRRTLQDKSLRGGEAKPLPYLLCQMNLLLHGLEAPEIDPANSLRHKLTDIGNRQRVDVILTNPPFGGEEEAGIRGNFPGDMQTAETALLFLQLIMRKLKRPQAKNLVGGRAAVVVPNGTLYEKGVAERIRRELLGEFNLHLIVRLPKGVFEPYTDIATNILFFDRSGATEQVWFYEHPLPPHRAHLKGRSYSATDGLKYSEFEPLLEWLKKPHPTDNAWAVPIEHLLENGCDLALIHPKHEVIDLPAPGEMIERATLSSRRVPELLEGIREKLESVVALDAPVVALSEILTQRTKRLRIQDGVEYTRPRVQLHFRGALVRDVVDGAEIGTRNQTAACTGDLIMSRIDARNGAMAIVPSELDGAIATNDFPVFEIDTGQALPAYLRFALFQPQMLQVYEKVSRGSTNRRRIEVNEFLKLTIPLPDLDTQAEIAEAMEQAEKSIQELREVLKLIDDEVDSVLASTLHVAFESKTDTEEGD